MRAGDRRPGYSTTSAGSLSGSSSAAGRSAATDRFTSTSYLPQYACAPSTDAMSWWSAPAGGRQPRAVPPATRRDARIDRRIWTTPLSRWRGWRRMSDTTGGPRAAARRRLFPSGDRRLLATAGEAGGRRGTSPSGRRPLRRIDGGSPPRPASRPLTPQDTVRLSPTARLPLSATLGDGRAGPIRRHLARVAASARHSFLQQVTLALALLCCTCRSPAWTPARPRRPLQSLDDPAARLRPRHRADGQRQVDEPMAALCSGTSTPTIAVARAQSSPSRTLSSTSNQQSLRGHPRESARRRPCGRAARRPARGSRRPLIGRCATAESIQAA